MYCKHTHTRARPSILSISSYQSNIDANRFDSVDSITHAFNVDRSHTQSAIKFHSTHPSAHVLFALDCRPERASERVCELRYSTICTHELDTKHRHFPISPSNKTAINFRRNDHRYFVLFFIPLFRSLPLLQ